MRETSVGVAMADPIPPDKSEKATFEPKLIFFPPFFSFYLSSNDLYNPNLIPQ